MVKQDLIDRSPVRYFEKVLGGGLKAGEIGVITSKKDWEKLRYLSRSDLICFFRERRLFMFLSTSILIM